MPQERAAILVKQHVKNDDVKKLCLHMEVLRDVYEGKRS